MIPSSILTLIEESTFCVSSPLGPLTVTTPLSQVTVTPAGILIGNFPILDIFYPPINKHSKEPHRRFSTRQLPC